MKLHTCVYLFVYVLAGVHKCECIHIRVCSCTCIFVVYAPSHCLRISFSH